MAIDLCPPAFVEGLLIDMLDNNMHAVGGATLINFHVLLLLVLAIWAEITLKWKVIVGMVVYEQAQLLASAWANESCISRLAINHALLRVQSKGKIKRCILPQHVMIYHVFIYLCVVSTVFH